MRVGRNRTIRSHPSWASLRSSELEEDLRALRIPPATNVTYLFGRFPDGTDRLTRSHGGQSGASAGR